MVIAPTHTENAIEFRRGNDTLLAIPVKDIEDLKVIPNPKTSTNKHAEIKIIFNDDQQSDKPIIFGVKNNKYIVFRVKNNKHIDLIVQQINLLRDAEVDPIIQKKIKSILNPEICSRCVKEEYDVEFCDTGKICTNCFEEQYGQLVLEADAVEYHGGDNDHNFGGILTKHQSGSMYLTENCLIFAKEDKEILKKWEIVIPLKSVVLDWDVEREQREMLIEWEGIDVNNFGFGSSFLEDPRKSFIIVVPYIDESGIYQEPRFLLHSPSGSVAYPTRNWISELYRMVIKSRINLAQQDASQEDIASHSSNNCFVCHSQFKIYDMNICDHCLLPFCTICIKNHITEPKANFDSKYLGGHKMHPKSSDTKVFVFSDRIELESPRLRITYNSMSNIENADEKKVSALRVVALGLVFLPLAIVGALWKKKHIYTIIEYTDTLNEEQTLVFDFGGKVEEAQQMMYSGMLAVKRQFSPAGFKEYDTVTTLSKPTEMNNPDDNPLHILKIRFAKGEISKEEYEEMRKIIES